MTPPRKTRPARALPERFIELPTFRLDILASIMSKHGELLYGRLFGLRLIECRVLGVVQVYQPVSLRRACVELGIDKSLGSRIVAKLVETGLLERRDDPQDQRSFYLLLSAKGGKVRERIMKAAWQRNETWMNALPEPQRAAFLQALDAQTARARQMLEEEEQRSGQPSRPAPSHERDAPTPREAGPVLVERDSLIDLHRCLGRLLHASGIEPDASS